jgi:hypothetical protein
MVTFSSSYKYYYVTADQNGNYFIMLDPGTYYVGCRINNTAITIQHYGLFMSSTELEEGKVETRYVSGVDWSIKLKSPGDSWRSEGDYPNVGALPLLSWEYDDSLYGEKLIYEVTLYYEKDGSRRTYYTKTSEEKNYQIIEPLPVGKYEWEVSAHTKANKDIARTSISYSFIVN